MLLVIVAHICKLKPLRQVIVNLYGAELPFTANGSGKREVGRKRASRASRRESRARSPHPHSGRETSQPRAIPARKKSENHISGGCVVSRSSRDVGGFAACMVPFIIAWNWTGGIQFHLSLRVTEGSEAISH